MSKTAATLPGIVMPSLTNAIAYSTDPHTLRHQWQTVFIVCAVVCVGGGIFYAVFAKGELQSFDKQEQESAVTPLLKAGGNINSIE